MPADRTTSRPAFALPVLAATLLLASACASTPRPGPGSGRPYTVRGQTYTPLTTWEGYAADGLASYYGRGDGFHGRRTANGERFDASAHTAAHRTLPMNSCVAVTSERTGRRTVVRINDRGPFTKGRVIDVSAAAADEIGLTRSGVAPVRVEAFASADADGRCPGAPESTFLSRIGAWFADLI